MRENFDILDTVTFVKKRYQNNITKPSQKVLFLGRLANLTKYFIKNSQIPHFVIVFCETVFIFS